MTSEGRCARCVCVSESFGDEAVRVWRSARFQDTSFGDKFKGDSEPSPAQGERGVCQFVPHDEPQVDYGSFASLWPTCRSCRLTRPEIQIHKRKWRQGIQLLITMTLQLINNRVNEIIILSWAVNTVLTTSQQNCNSFRW